MSDAPSVPTFEPTHTPAAKIVDAHLDLRTRFDEAPFCDSFLGLAAWTMLPPDAPDHEITETVAEIMYGPTGRHVLDRIRTGLTNADSYRISPDMVALALHTSESLDETDLVDLDMAPSPNGFVRLELPLPSLREAKPGTDDPTPRVTPISWLFWYSVPANDAGVPAPRSVVAWMFHDMSEYDSSFLAEPDEMGPDAYEAWRSKVGRWHPEWRTGLRQGESVGPALTDYAARDMEPDLKLIRHGVAAAVISETRSYTDINPARFLYGLWMVMAQPVAVVEPEDADRPARRRAARSSLSGSTRNGQVRLVALRRERTARPADEDQTEVDGPWDDSEAGRRSRVRWITRQHWRWQPYGPRKGVEHEHSFGVARAEDGIMTARCRLAADEDVVAAGRDDGSGGCPASLRRILIDSYVKGPEGAPLKMSRKVYDVT